MRKYLEKREQQRMEMERLSRTPANLRLKYFALGVIGIGIILMLIMIFCFDHLSWTAMLVMRGTVGMCAIIFFVLCGVLIYRVNSSYWRDRGKVRTPNERDR